MEGAAALMVLSRPTTLDVNDASTSFVHGGDDQQPGCSNVNDDMDEGTQTDSVEVQHGVAQTDNVDLIEKGTQTVYNKYILAAKIETMIMKNAQVIHNSEQEADTNSDSIAPTSSILSLESVKNDDKKMKFFTHFHPFHGYVQIFGRCSQLFDIHQNW